MGLPYLISHTVCNKQFFLGHELSSVCKLRQLWTVGLHLSHSRRAATGRNPSRTQQEFFFWSKRGLTWDGAVSLIKIVIYYFQQECGLMETEIKVAAAHRDSTIQLISWAATRQCAHNPQSTLGLELLVGQERVPNGFKDLWDRSNPKRPWKIWS